MLCHVSLLLTKLKRQYFAVCASKMAELIHSFLCLKGEEPVAGEVTKLVLKLGLADGLDSPVKTNSSLPNTPWGSPKTRKSAARPDTSSSSSSTSLSKPQNSRPTSFRILSLFERKSSPPEEERQSSFYVDIDESLSMNSSGSGGNTSATGQKTELPSTLISTCVNENSSAFGSKQEVVEDIIEGDLPAGVMGKANAGLQSLNAFNSGSVAGKKSSSSFDPLSSETGCPSTFSLTVGKCSSSNNSSWSVVDSRKCI